MSNFWGTVLGTQAPTPPAPVPQQTVPWSPSPYFGAPLYAQPQPDPQQAAQQPQQGEETNQWGGTAQGSAQKSPAARQKDTCPECGSGDYFAIQGQPNAMKQCYTCGYNPRFAHSTAGAGMPGGENSAPASPSRQTATGGRGGKSNFQPQNPAAGRLG